VELAQSPAMTTRFRVPYPWIQLPLNFIDAAK
jgi:hypothetical protein